MPEGFKIPWTPTKQCVSNSDIRTRAQTHFNSCIQVAVLALLLVLEARCVHFVIAHFNYFVLWSSASLAPTQHIYMYT